MEDRLHRRRAFWLLLLFALVGATPAPADDSPALPSDLSNGGLEEVSADGSPSGWYIPPIFAEQGHTVSVDSEQALVGELAAVVDSTRTTPGPSSFGNIMQTLDATAFRGKRMRLRAAVRIAGLSSSGQAQLWLRVDLPGVDGRSRMGAFDNMGNRPIRDDEWRYYEIVADVEEDAERIGLGMIVFGKEKAWLDDVTLEEVGDEVQSTVPVAGSMGGSAPQPFFNRWLWLAAIAIGLMFVSQASLPATGMRRYALRFAVIYWLLYSFPVPFSVTAPVVRLAAAGVLGIDRQLVPPGGSGDTTFDFVRLFVCFSLSIAGALVWSAIDRRKSDQRVSRDLLRSYLRYVLAITLLGYGLAKAGSAMNQFPAPGVDQLLKPYGESSPMNLVWTLMGASRPYTYFAAAGEIAAAILLLWRRTAIPGALVAAGVMTNVVMLNFSYDVPVKQYSAHLLLMAIYILLPDAGRLAKLSIGNRPVEAVDISPPYVASEKTRWLHHAVKTLVILVAILLPIGSTIVKETRHDGGANEPAFFGSYRVEEFRLDGEVLPPRLDDSRRWRRFTVQRAPWAVDGGSGSTDYVTIHAMDGAPSRGTVKVADDERSFTLTAVSPSIPAEIDIDFLDAEQMTVSGSADIGRIDVKLRRVERESFLLINRGFRWINEYPFNR